MNTKGFSSDLPGKSPDSHLRELAAGSTERELPQSAQPVPKGLYVHQDHWRARTRQPRSDITSGTKSDGLFEPLHFFAI